MTSTCSNVFHIAFRLLASLGIGLLITCTATNYWQVYEYQHIKTHVGLFKNCSTMPLSSNTTLCRQLYRKLPAKFATIVAMMVLSILFEFLVIVVGIMADLSEKNLNGILAVFQTLAVSSSVTGLVMYLKYYRSAPFKLDWSYAVGWTGAGLLGVGIVVIIVIMIR